MGAALRAALAGLDLFDSFLDQAKNECPSGEDKVDLKIKYQLLLKRRII